MTLEKYFLCLQKRKKENRKKRMRTEEEKEKDGTEQKIAFKIPSGESWTEITVFNHGALTTDRKGIFLAKKKI